MPWIAEDRYLTLDEMRNNAEISLPELRNAGWNDLSIAAAFGNIQIESTFSPALNEVGGSGYGLVQWTPMSVLIEHAQTLGLSPYTDGSVQIRVMNAEVRGQSSVNEWYTSSGFISPYYESGATSDMVGVSGQQFIENTFNWSVEKLTTLFMVAYLRPSYDSQSNFWQTRRVYASLWLEWINGTHPSKPPIPSWNVPTYIQWGGIAETIRRRRIKL